MRGRSFVKVGLGLLLLISFSAPSLHAFVLISNGGKIAKWPNGVADYYMSNFPDEYEAALQNSFEAWQSLSGIDLQFVPQGNLGSVQSRDDKSTMTWVEENWTSLSFRPPSNALAVTLSSFDSGNGEVTDADIYFNDDYFDWGDVVADGDENIVDVENIATHEIGHMIGLDHSSVNYFEDDEALAEATMFYASGAGETSRREPKTDDILGVTALYSSDPMPQATISGVTEIERVGKTVLYRITGSNFNEYTSFIVASSSFSMGDVVARYKTILSSTVAEVEFNFSGFYDSTPQFMVVNAAGEEDSIDYELDSEILGDAAFNAFDDGGGGCEAKHRSTGFDMMWIFILGLLSLGLRRSVPGALVQRLLKK